LKGIFVPGPGSFFFSVCFLATMNLAASSTTCSHCVMLFLTTDPKVTGPTMDWNLWNCEPK
jgi:hypothetical protein